MANPRAAVRSAGGWPPEGPPNYYPFSVGLIKASICSQVMPFGELAALEVSGILLAPVVGAVLYSRCVKCLDVVGVVGAAVGVLLITRPGEFHDQGDNFN
jgi:hypothetical protein